jgi:hypothetical protein
MNARFAVHPRLSTSCLFAALVLGASYVQAQSQAGSTAVAGVLRGVVTDSAGFPLANAEVRIMSEQLVAHSDSSGAFVMRHIQSRVVEVTVRHLGYQLRVVHVAIGGVESDSIHVNLFVEPVLLAPIEIIRRNDEGSNHPFMVEFERRREQGIGTFIMADEIKRLNTSYASDAFRGVPGARLVRINGGGMGIRFQSYSAVRAGRGGVSDCTPMIWIDGQRAPNSEVDDVRAADIYGIEIYHGASTIPTQFTTLGPTQCGAIVIWTKRK